MSNPIVIAHHLIFSAYGWWLPNDPRGSSSYKIRNHRLAELGALHHGRKKVQPAGWTIREFYREAASGYLKHALLTFSEHDVREIGDAFRDVIEEQTYTCWACVVMPDHVHLLIRKHKHKAEEMIENFQTHSRLRLRALGSRKPNHPVWGGPGWKVFLDHRPRGVANDRVHRKEPAAVEVTCAEVGVCERI